MRLGAYHQWTYIGMADFYSRNYSSQSGTSLQPLVAVFKTFQLAKEKVQATKVGTTRAERGGMILLGFWRRELESLSDLMLLMICIWQNGLEWSNINIKSSILNTLKGSFPDHYCK